LRSYICQCPQILIRHKWIKAIQSSFSVHILDNSFSKLIRLPFCNFIQKSALYSNTSIVAEIHLTVSYVPVPIIITGNSDKRKIHFTVYDQPPTVAVPGYCIRIKINLSVLNVPPAVTVLRHRIVKDDLTIDNMPPTLFPVDGTADNIINKLNFSVFTIKPYSVAKRKACKIEIYFSALTIPPTITVLS